MGTVFRKKRGGKPYGYWIAKWRDGAGIVRTESTACKGKREAMSRLSELEARAERERAGLLTPSEARAAEWATMPIERHTADYISALKSRGRTARHARDMEFKLKRVASELHFRRIADLSRTALETWLGAQREEGMPARTSNAYAGAAVAFGNWLLRAGRASVNPFAGIEKVNEAADRRHVRRALSPEELGRLLEAAEARPLHDVLAVRVGPNKGKAKANVRPEAQETARRLGIERALFYRLMAYTGLRYNEAKTLCIADLVLDGPRPTVTLRAEHEKARKGATLPLQGDLASRLSKYLQDRIAWDRADSERLGKPIPARLDEKAPLFPNAPTSVRVFDRDLVAAGLAYRDERGKIVKTDARGRTLDIHSLRGTYASMLAAAGVPLATAQVLMRHSTPALTMKHYVDPGMLDTAGAVGRLPVLDCTPEQARKNTPGVGQ